MRTNRAAVVLLALLASLVPLRTGVEAAERHVYTYDALGRLVKAADADGDGISYSYDANGNLLSRVVVDDVIFRNGFE